MPKDLKIEGKRATFTVSVVYETHELYGTVKASRTVTIDAD